MGGRVGLGTRGFFTAGAIADGAAPVSTVASRSMMRLPGCGAARAGSDC